MTIYSDYTRARIGWFFGLSGPQAILLLTGAGPLVWALSAGRWATAGLLTLAWLVLLVLVAVPVRGRSATGWLLAAAAHTLGGALGWTRYRSAVSHGTVTDPDSPDLPGVLAGVEIHDGPPTGPAGARVALIQHHATRAWAVTAAVTHPGIGMTDPATRTRYGHGLAALLDQAARGELIEAILVMVRTVPDDGAERAEWISRHRRPSGPALARAVNDDLAHALTGVSVRTEQYVTLLVPEARLHRQARHSGGGRAGRARVLHTVMAEAEAALRGPVGMSEVSWLTSPELALAVRTGFAPEDRAGVVAAHAAHALDPQVQDRVPWSMAGPSGTEPAVRHYRHDAWSSVSATLTLPAQGAVLGALAPVVTPSEPGERRCLLVVYPITPAAAADRHTGTAEWNADLAAALRARLGVKERARQREDTSKVRGLDSKLARGHAMTRPYAIATVTVPAARPISDYARRLDAAIRRAGFAPQRLDLAHDTAFAASTLPLGLTLTPTRRR